MSLSIKELLSAVREGSLSVEEAERALRAKPFADLGYAKPDLHRRLRQGVPEVIYGAGKTPEQIVGILDALTEGGQEPILITRLSQAAAEAVKTKHPIVYYPEARIGRLGDVPKPDGLGDIVIVTGGTSDLPVAEEAARTAETFGNSVVRVYDVGVAGLHRLLAQLDTLLRASVIICVAGMEGALASVVGGLVDCPVVAVPTSVGYGAAFEGLAALLSMLNSCASGVSVVNIDNGFGAAYQASRINHMERR
ncbi:MAG: nickel pincer cofactor biosynthesis protein LarB [Lachnospiraceae bacterium]|nr:nickel pincer cofactor biosynthesis protein LarB [Lachnospiraceae bacterium]